MRKSGEVRLCQFCQAEFYVPKWQIETVPGGGRFCSQACKHNARRGVERVTDTRYVRKDGYVSVKIGIRQRELEHRLVMERLLGRKLETDEHVHHLDGDRANNDLSNLVVMTNAEHQRLHDHLDVMHVRRTVTLRCVVCGEDYQTRPSRALTSTCCSEACRLINMRAGRKPKK